MRVTRKQVSKMEASINKAKLPKLIKAVEASYSRIDDDWDYFVIKRLVKEIKTFQQKAAPRPGSGE